MLAPGPRRWPTSTLEVKTVLRPRLRRTLDAHTAEHGGNTKDKTWLLIAWAQQNRHVPRTLERPDNTGDAIPFWISLTIRRAAARAPSTHPGAEGRWCEQWRLLYRAIMQRAGGQSIPVTNDLMIRGAWRSTHTRNQIGCPAARDKAQDMINWMASTSLLQSPHRRTGEALQEPPARGGGSACPPPRAATCTRKSPPRGIPFTIENPKTMLYGQRWFQQYNRYLSFTPLCRWGGAYKKDTCLWHPFGRFHIECGRKCHHFSRPDASREGDDNQTRHPWSIGNEAYRKLSGPMEIVIGTASRPGCSDTSSGKESEPARESGRGSWIYARDTRRTGQRSNHKASDTSGWI